MASILLDSVILVATPQLFGQEKIEAQELSPSCWVLFRFGLDLFASRKNLQTTQGKLWPYGYGIRWIPYEKKDLDLTTEAAEPEPKIIKSFEQKNPMKLR